MSFSSKVRTKRPKLSLIMAACLGATALLLTGCGNEKQNVKAAGPSEAPAVSVVVTRVVQKTVPLFTELTARTDATDTVDIRARVKAFLEAQRYAEGTMVKAGQILFTLDKREYEAQLDAGSGPDGESRGGSGAGERKVDCRGCAGQRADCYGAFEQGGSGRKPIETSGRVEGRTATGL